MKKEAECMKHAVRNQYIVFAFEIISEDLHCGFAFYCDIVELKMIAVFRLGSIDVKIAIVNASDILNK